MDCYGSTKKFFSAAAAGLAVAVMTQSVTADETTTSKLYINKSVSTDNFILLEGPLAATVSHTSEGLELEIPGVTVTLSCDNTEQDPDNPADSCTVAIGAGATIGDSSNDSSSNDSSSNDSSSNDSSSNDSSSNDSSSNDSSSNDSSSNDSSSNDSSSNNDTSNVTNSTSKCGKRLGPNTVECNNSDYGPKQNSGTVEREFTFRGGKVHSYRFTMDSGSGMIQIVPRLDGLKNRNGAAPKFYLSEEPGDISLVKQDRACSVAGRISTLRYSTSSSSKFCTLKPNKRYYLNLTSCTTASTVCTSRKAKALSGAIASYLIIN